MAESPQSEIPAEYKNGAVEFLGCKIDLSLRPLIPRPETEFWTRRAIVDLARRGRGVGRVLDLFAGSGCVGIAVAKNLPAAAVDFGDIDAAAVGQIKINLKINRLSGERVRVFQTDIFENIPPGESYDAILANPPYVAAARIGEVQKSVLEWEPSRALFAGADGMEIIRKFLRRAGDFLRPGGVIYMEFDILQKISIIKLLKDIDCGSFEFHKDQFQKRRFIRIKK